MLYKVTKIASIYNRTSLNLDFWSICSHQMLLLLCLWTWRPTGKVLPMLMITIHFLSEVTLDFFLNGRTLKDNCAHINICLKKRDCKQTFNRSNVRRQNWAKELLGKVASSMKIWPICTENWTELFSTFKRPKETHFFITILPALLWKQFSHHASY